MRVNKAAVINSKYCIAIFAVNSAKPHIAISLRKYNIAVSLCVNAACHSITTIKLAATKHSQRINYLTIIIQSAYITCMADKVNTLAFNCISACSCVKNIALSFKVNITSFCVNGICGACSHLLNAQRSCTTYKADVAAIGCYIDISSISNCRMININAGFCTNVNIIRINVCTADSTYRTVITVKIYAAFSCNLIILTNYCCITDIAIEQHILR